jgi:hypothetical protein
MVASARLWFLTGALEASRIARMLDPSLVVNDSLLSIWRTINGYLLPGAMGKALLTKEE